MRPVLVKLCMLLVITTDARSPDHDALCVGEEAWESMGAAEAVRSGLLENGPPASKAQPFVFLHVPKTGGSTMRTQLVEGASRLGYRGETTAPVGGHQPRFEFYDHKVSARQLSSAALMAGHLTWGTLRRMAHETPRLVSRGDAAKNGDDSRRVPCGTEARLDADAKIELKQMSSQSTRLLTAPAFSCLVLVRHPIER